MIDFSKPRMTRMYQVKNGKVFFVCSCGKLSVKHIKEFNQKCRCKDCETYNDLLLSKLHYSQISEVDMQELFTKIYLNGLLDYVESFSNGK